MNKKKNADTNIAAVISIGPDLIKMRISTIQNGRIHDLDKLESSTNLGHEIFNTNKISFECLRAISVILRGYSTVLKEYGVINYRVISSTFFREAKNAAYVIDQLKIQNDMTLEVLEDGQEKSLIYSEIIKNIKNDKNKKTTLIAYIGASSIGVALFCKESIIFYQNVRIGSLKLHDLLGEIQDQTNDFHVVLEEYLDRMIGRINIPIEKENIDNLIIAGSQIKLIEKFCGTKLGNKTYNIESECIYNFYKTINTMTAETMGDKYILSQSEAELLFTSIAIYGKIINMTNLRSISSSQVELWDAVMHQLLIPRNKLDFNKHVKESVINCAKVMADHYYCSKVHQGATYDYATLIFDKMEKIHGLNERKRLLLELAIILHETGYYVNSKYPRISSFDIIKNLELYGLTKEEVLLVANIARYDELNEPNDGVLEYSKLSEKNKLAVSKMVAIFRLANALDKSKKQKFKSIKIKLFEEKLIITVESDENVYLEKWAFNKCVPFFEEVFGVNPQLVVKTLLF
ncbi:MAG: Guanosine-5'-triphosphate,3'-diphosphate pyrophosphatase [Eubacteriales bacterium SKADARSKE-1]|nr:Guanosine-5'-triphosphate,3'-diphosphate pyrophosphatase [Eubacteriales bacterium SKADARSKE-1]